MTDTTPCPFCTSPMQLMESTRYVEFTCTNPPCQGHADIPIAWVEEVYEVASELLSGKSLSHRRRYELAEQLEKFQPVGHGVIAVIFGRHR